MLSFIKRRKVPIIIVLAAVIVVFVAISARGNGVKETIIVSRGELVRTVELAGKVVPADDADLAFEISGTVSRSYKKVGDKVRAGETIAVLDQSATLADLRKAESDLAAAKAELQKLEGGNDQQALITNSKTDVVRAIHDAYTYADDAVYNRTDQFFENAREPNPEILYAFDDYKLKDRINASRVVVGETLASFKALSSTVTADTYVPGDLEKAKTYLRDVSTFLSDVSEAVNSFETNSALTQTTIDSYRAAVATARQNLNVASAALIKAEQGLIGDIQDAPVQAARVSSAAATVANHVARLEKMTLKSPISGIVSRQDAKSGEAVSANATIASVISGDLIIEAYVPEVSIAGVKIGAPAKVTLDAYTEEDIFDAEIIRIDPRETMRDGVSTYKIELSFGSIDDRVRSGMTSNISIESMRKEGVLIVPERALTKEGSERKAVVKNNGDTEFRTVEVGSKDTKGNIEIKSGLSEGETILVMPKK